jgi:hypothetical protein
MFMKKSLLTLMALASLSSFAVAQEVVVEEQERVVLTVEEQLQAVEAALVELEEKSRNPETPLSEEEQERKVALEEELDHLQAELEAQEA